MGVRLHSIDMKHTTTEPSPTTPAPTTSSGSKPKVTFLRPIRMNAPFLNLALAAMRRGPPAAPEDADDDDDDGRPTQESAQGQGGDETVMAGVQVLGEAHAAEEVPSTSMSHMSEVSPDDQVSGSQ